MFSTLFFSLEPSHLHNSTLSVATIPIHTNIFYFSPQLESWVREAGFTNIHSKTLPFPVGTWPKDKTLKEVGAFNLIQYLDNIEGMTIRVYTQAWGWSAEEVKVLCAQLRKEFKNPRMRMQHNFYVAYGRKPENAVD